MTHIQGAAMLLGILHAKETGISSGCLGLKLVCAITYLFYMQTYFLKIIKANHTYRRLYS